MKEKKPERKRLSVQLFSEDEELLKKIHLLAEARRMPLRTVVMRALQTEVERHPHVIAKAARFRAEMEKETRAQ